MAALGDPAEAAEARWSLPRRGPEKAMHMRHCKAKIRAAEQAETAELKLSEAAADLRFTSELVDASDVELIECALHVLA